MSPRESEAQVQASIVEVLRLLGFHVAETSERRPLVRCPRRDCGELFRPHHGTGVTRGIGDLLVRHVDWPLALWLNLEVKSRTGRLTQEQERAVLLGRIVVVRNAREAVDMVEYTHRTLLGDHHPTTQTLDRWIHLNPAPTGD
jgi:hypothetical protein